MSVVETRSCDSLSSRLLQPIAHPDSEDISRQHARGGAISPTQSPTVYAPTFSDRDTDSDNDDGETSSMASSTMTGRLPALTRGNSTASSTSSAMRTDTASVLQGGFVLSSDDGILTIPSSHHEPDADLLCPFQILDCTEIFSSVREFKIHVFSHFRGQPLPTSATCFLCDEKFDQTPEDDPALAWNRMLGHMAHNHFRRGEEYGTLRADFTLMRWMYDRKIITDHQFKRAQMRPDPVLFPAAAGRRASEVSSVFTPEAPSPPMAGSPTSPTSVISEGSSSAWSRRSSYSTQTYVTFAGPRAERRRRDSIIRPLVRQAY